jgi:hypothetical protein
MGANARTRLLSLIIAIFFSAALAGCDQLPFKMPLSGLAGYADCLKEGQKAGVVSQPGLKIYCTAKYQIDLTLNSAQTTGHAGLTSCTPEVDVSSAENLALERTCTNFEGTLDNKTTNFVITSITITIINKRTKKSEIQTVNNLWIEPDGLGTFNVLLDYPFKRKNWYALNDEFEWNVATAKSFKINY